MRLAAVVLGIVACCAALPAASQAFPAKPIRFVVAFEASSAGDAMAQAVVARLNSDVVRALNVPEVRDKLASMGMSVVGASPEETGARLKRDIALSARIIKAAGIRSE